MKKDKLKIIGLSLFVVIMFFFFYQTADARMVRDGKTILGIENPFDRLTFEETEENLIERVIETFINLSLFTLEDRGIDFIKRLIELTDLEGRLYLVSIAEEFNLDIQESKAVLRELADRGILREIFGYYNFEFLEVIKTDENNNPLFDEYGYPLLEDYVRLRGNVHTDVTGCWHLVGRAIFIIDGQIVLQLRNGLMGIAIGVEPGRLEILGGHLSPGFRLSDGTIQEIKEETHLEIIDTDRLKMLNSWYLAIGIPDVQDLVWQEGIFMHRTSYPIYNYEVSGLVVYNLNQEEYELIQRNHSLHIDGDVEAVGLEIWKLEDLLKEIQTNTDKFDDSVIQYFTNDHFLNEIRAFLDLI